MKNRLEIETTNYINLIKEHKYQQGCALHCPAYLKCYPEKKIIYGGYSFYCVDMVARALYEQCPQEYNEEMQ